MCQTKLKIQIFTHKRPLQSGDLYPRDRDDGNFTRRWKLALWEFCKNRKSISQMSCRNGRNTCKIPVGMIYGNHYCTNGTDFCGDWWEGMETGWGQVEMEMKSTRMSGDGCDSLIPVQVSISETHLSSSR